MHLLQFVCLLQKCLVNKSAIYWTLSLESHISQINCSQIHIYSLEMQNTYLSTSPEGSYSLITIEPDSWSVRIWVSKEAFNFDLSFRQLRSLLRNPSQISLCSIACPPAWQLLSHGCGDGVGWKKMQKQQFAIAEQMRCGTFGLFYFLAIISHAAITIPYMSAGMYFC